MKLRHSLIIGCMTALLGVGAFVGLNVNKEARIEKAEATTYTGSFFLQLNTNDWKWTGSDICCLLEDTSSNTEWGPCINPDGSSTYYTYSYSASINPKYVTIFRFYHGSTPGDWLFDWNNGGLYSRTANRTEIEDVIWLGDTINNSKSCEYGSYTLETHVVDGASFDVELTNYSISDGHLEASGSVTFTSATSFYLYPKCDGAAPGAYVTKYGHPSQLDSAFSGGNGSAITCSVPGTYDFFFKFLDTKEVWITNDAIVEADAWAIYFNANVECDSTYGQAAPGGWGKVSSEYAKLSGDAKDVVFAYSADPAGDNLARALATYDWAVSHNPTHPTRFIVDSNDNVRALPSYAVISGFPISSDNSTNLGVVTAISVAFVATIAAAGFVFLRKKKSI